MTSFPSFLLFLLSPLVGFAATAVGAVADEPADVPADDTGKTTTTSLTQYGITWTFERPVVAGRFVTGDWWVVGPVVVAAVSPGPGPSTAEESGQTVKSRYGATSMTDDRRMRNGSMVSPRPGPHQGYDSRLRNFRPERSARFPLSLEPGAALVSTISNETLPARVMHHALMWSSERMGSPALDSAAILTVLAESPPEDAFRPAYAGGAERRLHRAADLRRERLPTLKVPEDVNLEWDRFERYLERPWLDHVTSWLVQHQGPFNNQVNYGREFSRVTSIASLMLLVDVPPERKEKLLLRLVQLGIDLRGLAGAGRHWTADGGHWNGRKWPILFAGILLDDEGFARQAAGTTFSEDQQFYHGKGWQGATALYRIVNHTGPKPAHEEKHPKHWDEGDKLADNYRIVVSGGSAGTALAARLMGATELWNNDAFFDYFDRWMTRSDPYAEARGAFPRPKQEGRTLDTFVDAMWAAHRGAVPPPTRRR